MSFSSGTTVLASACCLLQQTWGLQQSPLQQSPIFGYYNLDKPPPRVGHSAPIDLAKTAVTVKHLQDFVAASSEGYASIVTIGDSTMAGITADLMTLTEDIVPFKKLLYTSNDRPMSVRFTSDNSVVEPGGEWYDHDSKKDPRAKLIVERSLAATQILHGKNCSWAGGVESFLFDGGPLNGFALHAWNFIPEYGETCWRECFPKAVEAFKSSAVLWNVGFHLLNHKFDEPTCERRQNMAKENCGSYGDLVTMGTEQLLDVAPIVVWRTTNYLCETKQRKHIPPQIVREFEEWENLDSRPKKEKECHKNCDLMDDFTCYDWLMSPESTRRLYGEGLLAINDLKKRKPHRASQIRILNTFNATKECCDRGCETETDDGEHYRGLDRNFIDTFAAMLVHA